MISDLIRLSALYVLVRVFVVIAMPKSKIIVKYIFYTGIALTILGTVGPYLTRVLDDVHDLSVAYVGTKKVANNVLGDSTKVDVGYQSVIEKWLGNVKFDWPTKGKITQGFNGKDHHGIDLAGDIGDKIKASRPGKVSKVGEHEIYGHFIVINHGNGWETLYAHCSEIVVTEGREILNGDTIGMIGSSGKSSGPHLHFEIKVKGTCVNPTKYLE